MIESHFKSLRDRVTERERRQSSMASQWNKQEQTAVRLRNYTFLSRFVDLRYFITTSNTKEKKRFENLFGKEAAKQKIQALIVCGCVNACDGYASCSSFVLGWKQKLGWKLAEFLCFRWDFVLSLCCFSFVLVLMSKHAGLAAAPFTKPMTFFALAINCWMTLAIQKHFYFGFLIAAKPFFFSSFCSSFFLSTFITTLSLIRDAPKWTYHRCCFELISITRKAARGSWPARPNISQSHKISSIIIDMVALNETLFHQPQQ